MTHSMIGRVLNGRYQIVQILGNGIFGETYISIDIDRPQNPKCVVKQLKTNNYQSDDLQSLRLRFLREIETLKHIGYHRSIPQLISSFEENECFYLVQEFIEGHPLNSELPINEDSGYFWTEAEVTALLVEILEILDFVHSFEVIHCDVKPENLIRRIEDGQLVLIDFGSIQPTDLATDSSVLPIYRVPVNSLGYIPPEQFISQTQPNSDIYALGMIAIQALTGRIPLQLEVDPQTNQVIWRSPDTLVSNDFANIINRMICYNHKERYQSASEAIDALNQISVSEQWVSRSSYVEESPYEQKEPVTINAQYTVSSTSRPIKVDSESRVESPLLTGMKVGLAANSLVMGFGVYSLMNNSPAHSETEALSEAKREYHSGDFSGAIALVKSIPASSQVYPQAQATIGEWQEEWQIAGQKFQAAQIAFDDQRWPDVVRAAAQVPDISYWQSKTDKLLTQARSHIEIQTNDLLAQAYEKARDKDFSAAIHYLRQIPDENLDGNLIKDKLAEYTEKQQIRATYLLQQAYEEAADGEFEAAIDFLNQVPENTPVYGMAQIKLVEYAHKQRVLAQANSVNASPASAIENADTLIPSTSLTQMNDFYAEDYLHEININ